LTRRIRCVLIPNNSNTDSERYKMPATIDKKTTKRPATKKAAAPKKSAPKAAPKAKKEKFVAPPKPTTEPSGINRKDYGYTTPGGKFKFWQGYDAKFKKNLMNISRCLPQSDLSEQARKILVESGWSTMEREEAMVALAQQKADRAVARIQAKADKAKNKATKQAVEETVEADTSDDA